MIDYNTFLEIKHLNQHHGLTCPQIARKLNLDERTVDKWLNENQFRQRKKTQRICDDGFDGGYTIVKEYVRKIRPKRAKAFLTLSFAAGECAQVDWGSYCTVPVWETSRRLSFFVMVLCYSRMMYVEFTVSQTMEHFLGCHQNAFHHFGAVPGRIMVDNLKSAVLKRFVGQDPLLNPKYKDFADYYGFGVSPCGVGKGNEKGRVENGVGYVKKNFLNGLEIPDFSAVNPAAMHWLDTVSNVRIHGETGRKPVDMFQEERPYLNTLPVHPYDIATIKPMRASGHFRITVDTNRYSVPAEYARQPLTVKIYPDRLCIYHKDNLIARHVRSYDRRKDFELPDHPKALLAHRIPSVLQWP